MLTETEAKCPPVSSKINRKQCSTPRTPLPVHPIRRSRFLSPLQRCHRTPNSKLPNTNIAVPQINRSINLAIRIRINNYYSPPISINFPPRITTKNKEENLLSQVKPSALLCSCVIAIFISAHIMHCTSAFKKLLRHAAFVTPSQSLT